MKKIKRSILDHRTHYIKVSLTNDLSLRHWLTFDAQPDKVGGWYLVSHKNKMKQKVPFSTVKNLSKCAKKMEEVIGTLDRSQKNYRKYRKIVRDFMTDSYDIRYE